MANHLLVRTRKPNMHQLPLYFMVKQVFQAAHCNTPFNLIAEEAMEWKWCEGEQVNNKKVRHSIAQRSIVQH